ncbi:MAG: SDR family NAD(P)-dependent oxidoreductase [Pigmentiphaga sp.]
MNPSSARTVLVTGASRGIGRVVARHLASQSVHCLLLARNAGALEDLSREIREAGGRADVIQCDLARLENPEALTALLSRHTTRLDGVLLNAALGGPRLPLTDYPTDLWRQVFQVNVHATQLLLAAVHPFLLESPAGRVVFVSTGVAQNWKANTGAYAASKAAVEAIAGIYAQETADTTIRSNILSPGATRTEMRAEAYPDEDPGLLKTPASIAPLFAELLSTDCLLHGALVKADQWLEPRQRT